MVAFMRTQKLPGEGFDYPIPLHWIRDWRMSGNGYKLLSYWVSHAVGYEVTIEQTIAEMPFGRDAVYAAIKELVEIEYLIKHQQDQAVKGSRNSWAGQRYDVGPAALEERYVRNWGQSNPDDTRVRRAEWTRPLKAPRKAGKNKTAGPSASGSSVYANSVYANSDTKGFNSSGVSTLQEDQNPPTPQARTDADATTPPPAQKRGEDSPKKDHSDPDLVALAERVASVRPVKSGRWTVQAVATVIHKAQALGHSRDLIERVLIIAAGDPMTRAPGRILASGFPGWGQVAEADEIAATAARSLEDAENARRRRAHEQANAAAQAAADRAARAQAVADGDPIAALYAELVAERPGWDRPSGLGQLHAALDAGRTLEEVASAARVCPTPTLFTSPAGPWWSNVPADPPPSATSERTAA